MTTNSYSHRSLIVLTFFGILSAIMSLLSVILIFQLQQTNEKESLPSVVPAEVSVVLMPVSAVLSALSLTLNLSSVVVCLLHSYLTAEICRGEYDTDRADWFLLDSRAVRHVAIGLFCLGVPVYLAAMSIYVLLVFEIETGITSACVLSSGVLVLLLVVAHSLIQAARTSRHFRSGEHSQTHIVYQNDPGSCPGVCMPEDGVRGRDKTRRQCSQSNINPQFSYPPCTEPKQQCPPGGGSRGSRMHRTLSVESGLLQEQAKPWNGVNNEMRTVLARKAGTISKDSTLV